jgi:hypothetical protein
MAWLVRVTIWIGAAKVWFSQSKSLAETIKEWLLCLSLLGAGAWGIYTFAVTQQEKRADQALAQQEKQQDLERKERERQRDLHPELITRLDALPLEMASGRYIKTTVTLENKGNDGLWVELGIYSLSVQKITFVEGQERSEILQRTPYRVFKDNLMLNVGSIPPLYLAQHVSTQLVYLSKVDSSIADPIKVTFMASYRHEKLSEVLASKSLHGKVFTTQPSEYVFFDKH